MLQLRVSGLGELQEVLEDLEMLEMTVRCDNDADEQTREMYFNVWNVTATPQKNQHVSYSEEEVDMFVKALKRFTFKPKVRREGRKYIIEYGKPEEQALDLLEPIMFDD